MVDIGAKVGFSRAQMIFNVDVEASVGDYFTKLYNSYRYPEVEEEGMIGDDSNAEETIPSPLQYLSGSFTFASVMEDFITGSRINIASSAVSWSKFFLFSGHDFQRYYPNFNPTFSRLSAMEYSDERRLTVDSLSFSLRRRLGDIFSIVASVSTVGQQTLRASYWRRWSLALVADDIPSGFELLVGFNHEGNCCVGFKKEIGTTGVSFRVSSVLKGFDCPNSDWKNCLEIGLEL